LLDSQYGLWEQDKLMENKLKNNYHAQSPNKHNIEGQNWKKNQTKEITKKQLNSTRVNLQSLWLDS
jgi:hypothetical protein